MRLMPRIVALLMLALLAPLVPAQEASRALERIFGDYEQDYLRLNPHEATSSSPPSVPWRSATSVRSMRSTSPR